MFHKIYTNWRKRKLTGTTNEVVIKSDTKEVEIPVGGITDDGRVYEREVKPYGNEPIYKEVHIEESNDNKEEKEVTGNKA